MNKLEVVVNATKKLDLTLLKQRIGRSNFFLMNYSGLKYADNELPSGLTVLDFNAGGSQADNWNNTINSCSGINSEYFCFFHDDDVYHSELYDHYIGAIDRHNPDIIYSECEFVTHRGARRYLKEFIYKRYQVRENELISVEDLVRRVFDRGFFVRTPSLCFSRSLVKEIHFEEKYGPFLDFGYMISLPPSRKVYLIGKTLFKYVDNRESETQRTVKFTKIAQEKLLYRLLEKKYQSPSKALVTQRLFFIGTSILKRRFSLKFLILYMSYVIFSPMRLRDKLFLSLKSVYSFVKN